MTINKSQGQTLDYVEIYLSEPVFSHGQLYVALSRVRNSSAVKALIAPGTSDDIKVDCKTRNVVFHDIFCLTNTWYMRSDYPYHWILISLWFEESNAVANFPFYFCFLKIYRMEHVIPVKDVLPGSEGRTCKVTVQEKQQITGSATPPIKKWKFILLDSEVFSLLPWYILLHTAWLNISSLKERINMVLIFFI